jgi:hypothetical protein
MKARRSVLIAVAGAAAVALPGCALSTFGANDAP